MTNYLAYAGIGSRETPQHILSIMHHIGAYLASEGWTLRSGAADGADAAFEKGADTFFDMSIALKEIYLPWSGFNHSISELHPGLIPFTQEEVDFTASYHPAWDKCSPAAKKLMTRNTRQILGCEAVNGREVIPVKFVVCWTPMGKMVGGTSQALRIASAIQVPIINLGSATNAQELEALVLEVDRLQASFKQEPVNA